MGKGREKIQWRNQLVNMLAIIIGVYIAFALNDCQVSKLEEVRKKESIISLKEDLLKDKTELEEGLEELDTIVFKISGLLRYANTGEGAYDSLNYFLQGIFQQPTFYANNFTFQSLVNSGDMGGLTDISFRKDILELYNGQYNIIKELDAIGLKNFQDRVITTLIQQGGRFEDASLKSPSFLMMVGVIQDLHYSRRKVYKESLVLIDKVLTQIEDGDI
jgi:hypothetical protein